MRLACLIFGAALDRAAMGAQRETAAGPARHLAGCAAPEERHAVLRAETDDLRDLLGAGGQDHDVREPLLDDERIALVDERLVLPGEHRVIAADLLQLPHEGEIDLGNLRRCGSGGGGCHTTGAASRLRRQGSYSRAGSHAPTAQGSGVRRVEPHSA
jgi:hypothetical protein